MIAILLLIRIFSSLLQYQRMVFSNRPLCATVTTMSDPKSHGASWREELLRRVVYVCSAIFIGVIVLSLFLGRPTAFLWFGVILGLASALMVVMSRLGFSYRSRAWTIVLSTLAASAIFYVFAGFNPGPVLSAALCIALAAMLLGQAAFIGVLTLMTTFLFGIALTMWLGVWSGPHPQITAVPTPTAWFWTTVVTVPFWLGLGYSLLYVVDAVETNVERLREEAKQRRKAHRRRREAEAVAAQAQKLEALGQLSAGIAHDFNNALLVLRGWNDILLVDDSPATRAKATDAINQSIDQAKHLASQLLTFGRSQARKPRYLEISEVVQNTADTLRRIVPAKFGFRTDIGESGIVLADEGQLQQLLFNLVINARDALRDGGTIDVRCRRARQGEISGPDQDDVYGWAIVEVEDDGVGIDADVKQRIFEPFFTTKETGKGTGLGLSTVFGIVKQSNATISVSSKPGDGTRFRIVFPLVDMAPQSNSRAESTARADREPLPKTQGGRIFVLEDDPLAQELLLFALHGAGFTTVRASNGHEAMKLINNDTEPFDLLSADVVFPGAGLDEVIATFKQHNPSGHVLICSGYVPEDISLEGFESGSYEYLAKPFTPKRLIDKISSMLGAG